MLAQIHATLFELGGGGVHDDAAAVEDDDLIGDVEHELRVLLDEDDREPCALSLRIVAITSATICGARPSEGSSISSTRGFDIRARPIASICCSPPESEAAIWCRRSLRRGKSADTVSSVHSIGRSPRGRRPATARFSRTVRLRKTRRPWGTSATPWAAIASGARPVTVRP